MIRKHFVARRPPLKSASTATKHVPLMAPMRLSFQVWLGGLLLTASMVIISVLWLDRPIATFIHCMFGTRHLSNAIVGSPELSIPVVSALVFIAFGLSGIMGRRFSKLEISVLLCDISILATDAIKNQLKYVFGRTWPDSWNSQIVSFVHDNVYGFNFFHHGLSFESFPSGHAAVTASVMTILWILFPRQRTLWGLCVCAANAGLVLLNLHFLSDVLAGTFVGISTGLFTLTLFAPTFGQDQMDVK
jgi:membrane-associated phospholipid phosphatase